MDHDEASLYVAELVRGDLAPERRAAVEAHLRDCADCRELAQAAELLAETMLARGPVASGDHPQSETLVELASNPERLAAAETRRIEQHLTTCRHCAEDVASARAVLAPSGQLAAFRRPALARAWRSANGRAALAAGIVLAVLAYPAYLGLQRRPVPPKQPPGETLDGSGAVDYLVLGDTTRGDPQVPATVRVAPGQTLVPLALQPDLDPEDHPGAHRVEILSADGATAWSTELAPSELRQRLDRGGIVLLQVPVRALVPGRYRLRLVDARSAEPLLDVAFVVAR